MGVRISPRAHEITEVSKDFFERHERVLSPATLIIGFIFDYFTLQRVDFLTDNLFIIFYILLAGGSIILINLREAGQLQNKFVESIQEFLPFTLQFAFGGLFSAFVIFYSKSASMFTSGAFTLILLVLLVGNEFFKKRYSKPAFQTGVYFAAVFSFLIYFVPVLTSRMGEWQFILSGLLSLLFIAGFVLIIYFLTKGRYKENIKVVWATIASIYIFINFLYFTNLIPPIPLSLRAGDVYHFVGRTPDGNYLAIGEADTWREKLGLPQSLYLKNGESVYVFSSVFAPTDLNINITHDWQYWNEREEEWISASRITFPIRGGRGEGYRGFSKKGNVFPGAWRVDIKTERGQVLGRVRFDIQEGTAALSEKII